MKALFQIELQHEYFGGRAAHLSLQPLAFVQTLVNKDRLRIKYESGGLKCFCEEDLEVLTEYSEFCFWLSYTSDDFLYYSDFPDDLLFDQPKYQWTSVQGQNELLMEPLSEAYASKCLKSHWDRPKTAIGIVALSAEHLNVGTPFQIRFKTKKTYWEYRIHAKQLSDNWQFTLEDTLSKWTFKQLTEQGKMTFRSTEALPYKSKADDRLLLKWENNEDVFQYQQFKKILPYPNFRYRKQDQNVNISPIHITI